MNKRLLVSCLLITAMWFNFCKWLKKDPTFEWVEKGKIEMDEGEQDVIKKFLEREKIEAKDLHVVTPGVYPKWNNRIHLENGKVQEFHIDGLVIKDLSFLTNFEQIQKILIRRANVPIIPDLSSLSSLSDLSFQNNQIKEVDLSHLPPLKKLNLGDNEIRGLKGFAELTSLESLVLSNNQIERIEGLQKMVKLQKLNLGHNNISKIDGLEELNSLVYLSLIYNQISEIENIAHLTNLRELHLAGNKIEDISYLEQMPFLRIIGLNTNQIKHITTPKLIENCYDFGIQSNPLSIFEKPMEAYTAADSLTHHLYIALFQKRAGRQKGLRKGGVRNMRRSGKYSESMLGGADGHIKGSIKRLYGLYSVTVIKSRYFSESVDVVVSIDTGVLRVLLQGTETFVIPRQTVKLSGRLFELGLEEKQLKFESMTSDVYGIKYEVKIGKNRD